MIYTLSQLLPFANVKQKTKTVIILILFFLFIFQYPGKILAQSDAKAYVIDEKLLYHQIHLSTADHTILPWYSENLAESYDFVINKVWEFWNNIRIDKNGLPYYMNHQVWREEINDPRGIGGDQLSMALSSWHLLYGYSGNKSIKENMCFLADYYLSHSLSPADAVWPNIPYPYNTLIYSGIYDGDMILGKGFTQPDKAGSFGLELVNLYKMDHPACTDNCYLEAAVDIANTLSKHIKEGDENNSPLPFKVNAVTGEIGRLIGNQDKGEKDQLSSYTTNWSSTMELFLNLIELNKGEVERYHQSFDMLLAWMKEYPLKNNKWGPFFEDVAGWSDTQINAITFARFMMNYPEYFPLWKNEVKGIFNWVYDKLGNKDWRKYGVVVVNEQTSYLKPGNSHTSRQASSELQYAFLTGDSSFVVNAVRQLNWATYMVDVDGKNIYPGSTNWLTDGYGDYVRHFLRAMAYKPDLALSCENHLLSTTSVIQNIEYAPDIPDQYQKEILVNYSVFDEDATEVFRMSDKPSKVIIGAKEVSLSDVDGNDLCRWQELGSRGGVLVIRHTTGKHIIITK
jgi:hypothetical protein